MGDMEFRASTTRCRSSGHSEDLIVAAFAHAVAFGAACVSKPEASMTLSLDTAQVSG